jgi:hypothetical protein
MEDLKHSALLSAVMRSLYTVACRRTSKKFADEAIGSTIKTLEGKYDFLRNISITEQAPSDDSISVHVSSDVDSVDPSMIGKVIESIIRVVYNDLSEDAGLYFITELKEHAGEQVSRAIKSCEVDLDQVQLEQHYAYRRRERKKRITDAAISGQDKRLARQNLIGYTWNNVSFWKHDPGSKFCTLYDKEGNVVDRLNLDKIIQNYVEKLSGYPEQEPEELLKQAELLEKEYQLLKLMLERDMDAETAANLLHIDEQELKRVIRKLSQMELLQYISFDTIELTDMGISFLSRKEKKK